MIHRGNQSVMCHLTCALVLLMKRRMENFAICIWWEEVTCFKWIEVSSLWQLMILNIKGCPVTIRLNNLLKYYTFWTNLRKWGVSERNFDAGLFKVFYLLWSKFYFFCDENILQISYFSYIFHFSQIWVHWISYGTAKRELHQGGKEMRGRLHAGEKWDVRGEVSCNRGNGSASHANQKRKQQTRRSDRVLTKREKCHWF